MRLVPLAGGIMLAIFFSLSKVIIHPDKIQNGTFFRAQCPKPLLNFEMSFLEVCPKPKKEKKTVNSMTTKKENSVPQKCEKPCKIKKNE